MNWWLRGRKSVKERKIKNDMDLLYGLSGWQSYVFLLFFFGFF